MKTMTPHRSRFLLVLSAGAVGLLGCGGQGVRSVDGATERPGDVAAPSDGQGSGGQGTGGRGSGGQATGGSAGQGGGGQGTAGAGGHGTGGGAGQSTGGAGGRGMGGAGGQATGGTGGRGTGGGGGGSGGAGGRGSGGAGGGTGGQGGDRCSWSGTYTVVDGGGLVAMLDTATFTPPAMFRYERRSFVSDAGQPSCSPALPPCGDPAGIDLADIERDITNADVQMTFTFATPPIYGNRAIADGPSFSFLRSDQRGFVAGIACNVPSATCMPIPAGVATLVADLRALITRQLADPSCAAFR